MSKTWSDSAALFLERRDLCPRCDYPITQVGRCTQCDADLGSPILERVASASRDVVEALRARQALVDTLPTLPRMAPRPPVAPAAPARATSEREGSALSVQSVLAVAGAALLAVAAIVFTFLNPDLTNFAVRTTIVAVTTVVFLGGAWLLARAKLQFSAESIGALGMVFVVLDVWAFAHNAPHGVSPFIFAGIGTAFAAAVMISFAVVVRIRSWLWLGLLGLAITPAWFGYAGSGPWPPIIGHLAVGFAALVIHELARRLGPRFGSGLRADHWMATVLELLVVCVVGSQLILLTSDAFALGIAAVLAGLAIMAALSTRNGLARVWSLLSGAVFTAAAVELAVHPELDDQGWLAALAPAGAAAALILLSLATRVRAAAPRHWISRVHLLVGSMTVLFGAAVFPLGAAILQYTLPLDHDVLSRILGLASALGLASTALGLLAIWFLGSRTITRRFRSGVAVVALSFGLAALISFSEWPALGEPVQVSIGLAGALALSLLVLWLTRLTHAGKSVRIPLIVAAHLLVLGAAIIAWGAPLASELGGAGAVLVFVAVTITMPRAARPVHTAIGFAYALVVFAYVLQLARLDTIALYCITTAVASASALVVTLVRRIPPRYWYAILIVTAVPFVIGIVTVLFVRSGWTALSTGVTFALALTLVWTSRPGLSRFLRGVAAALLVPALAVVVICLGAQFLRVSASPITLPVIAVIVACTLPGTRLIGAALRGRGLGDADVRTVQRWIEVSSLVTGACAAILALVRAAAGLGTSFLVLLIIGIGCAATALLMRRAWAWAMGAASWTGALWCYWGILGIQVLEPYLVPPAVAAAIIGAIAVLRKLPGLGLYSVGLACAVLPSLVVLAGWGNGAQTPWRLYGLLAGSTVLLVLGAVAARRRTGSRFGTLATPTLLVAMVAACAGPVEAVRVALGLDPVRLLAHQPVTITALELSLVATVLAGIAARFLVTPDRLARVRWRSVYMPAAVYLVVGPVFATRAGWLSVWILFGLMIVLLTLMIATAARARTRRVALPPVWFLFVLAWCAAVAGWSDRYLRVEAFSLPLGLALVAVGVIAMRGTSAPGRSLASWPVGFQGSWWLLTPGIVATFLPSILSTGTDPQTLRAILVIALALLAILIGSLRKLGAPFLLGIVVLPLENITVFAAQIGHTISATSWWITLATAGAVLLVIAVTYERRSSGERGVAARLRDLR
jgi:hypothetical protein